MMRDLQSATFLACSWFWCIGGFFPVLLYLEFGSISFPVFMVFNVLGAMLFAFVWTGFDRSRFLSRFGQSTRWFSALVVGYHFIFVTWISLLLQDARPIIGFVVVTLVFTALRRHLMALSIGVVIVTICLFGFIFSALPVASEKPLPSPFVHQILPLAFGFLLAPYFDLTFHRAYNRAARPRLVFVIGFGGVFATLLCGVYFGMPAFVGLLSADGLTHPAVAAVAVLLVVQTGFTTAAHVHELGFQSWSRQPLVRIIVVGIASLSLVHVVTFLAFPDLIQAFGSLIYRNFVFLVGVAFPVLLLFGGVNKQSITALVFLTPCFALGFLIGGMFAPLLSVGMAGLALFYWRASKDRAEPAGHFVEKSS